MWFLESHYRPASKVYFFKAMPLMLYYTRGCKTNLKSTKMSTYLSLFLKSLTYENLRRFHEKRQSNQMSH